MSKHFEKRTSFKNAKPSAEQLGLGSRTYPEERLSEYFQPDRAMKPVLRYELQALLVQYHKANAPWYAKLWAWLKAPKREGV